MLAYFVDFAEFFFRECDVVRIEVNGDEFAGREDAFENFGRVTGETEGAVDDDLAWARIEGGEDFVEEDGDVWRFVHVWSGLFQKKLKVINLKVKRKLKGKG